MFPHGYCYLWQSKLIWLHVASDLLIALAYFAIPCLLLFFEFSIQHKSSSKFRSIYALFAAFILLCGTTHLWNIWNIWHSNYLLSGITTAATGIVSLAAVVVLGKTIPLVLSFIWRVQEAEREQCTIIEHMPAGFFSLDQDLTLTQINLICAERLGLDRETSIGRKIQDCLPGSEEFLERCQSVIVSGEPVRFEEYYQALDKWFEIRAFSYKGGICVLFTDISDRKQAEARMLEELQEFQSLNEVKSQIITTVSHEYRTPLTTVQSSAELIDRYWRTWMSKQLQESELPAEAKQIIGSYLGSFDLPKLSFHLNRIRASCRHLTHLISDAQLLYRVESGNVQLSPRPTDVVAITSGLLSDYGLFSENHAVELILVPTDFPAVVLDAKNFRYILSNLVSNAIKYTPISGVIQVTLSLQNEEFILAVKDSGIGIKPTEISKLWDAFYRGTNVGTTPGTGMGLAIVRRCVELARGKISVESEVGVGTTFVVAFPMQ